MIRKWIGYDEEKAIIVDAMEYEGGDFDRIPGVTYVEIFPPLHINAIKLERDSGGNITIVRDDEAWVKLEPKLLRNFRLERNKRLADCDWITLKSYSRNEPVPDEWKAYMQALRDLPANTADPENPVWPQAPTP